MSFILEEKINSSRAQDPNGRAPDRCCPNGRGPERIPGPDTAQRTHYCCAGLGASAGAGAPGTGVIGVGCGTGCVVSAGFFFSSARRVFSLVVVAVFFFLVLPVSPFRPSGPDCVARSATSPASGGAGPFVPAAAPPG